MELQFFERDHLASQKKHHVLEIRLKAARDLPQRDTAWVEGIDLPLPPLWVVLLGLDRERDELAERRVFQFQAHFVSDCV